MSLYWEARSLAFKSSIDRNVEMKSYETIWTKHGRKCITCTHIHNTGFELHGHGFSH
jgi:hypothetical protein